MYYIGRSVGRRGEEGDPDKHSYSDKAAVAWQGSGKGEKGCPINTRPPRHAAADAAAATASTTINCGRRTPLRRYNPRITRAEYTTVPRSRRRTIDGQNRSFSRSPCSHAVFSIAIIIIIHILRRINARQRFHECRRAVLFTNYYIIIMVIIFVTACAIKRCY